MIKYMITGSSGFVGRNLSRYLNERGLDFETISLRETGWRKRTFNGGTAVVHLAGKAHDTSNTSSHQEYFEVNLELTKEVFDEFLRSDCEDFFYFSSVKAVADSVDGVLFEDVLGEPLTPYGKSKLEAENMLLAEDLPAGKRLFIIRPCMIHGPGNKGNLNLLYKVVEKGLPWPLAKYNNKRSFLSIENLCYLLVEMHRKKNLASGVYNFADDESLSTTELVSIIAYEIGSKPRLWRVPMTIVNTIGAIGNILKLPINSERIKKLTESYVVSNIKVKEALQISSLPVSAKAGLQKTVQSFQGGQN